MKKIIFVTMIISSCHIDALEQRLSRLWSPLRQATKTGFSTSVPAIRNMATGGPVQVQEVSTNQTLWQKFRGWFSKKPVNFPPANITIREQLRAINFELETVKKLVENQELVSQAEILAKTIKNVEDHLSSHNNVLPNDTIGQIRKKSEERLLLRLKENSEAGLKSRELNIRAAMRLQDMIDEGFFKDKNIDINDPEMFNEAVWLIKSIQESYLYNPYMKISLKMTPINDNISILETNELDVMEYIQEERKKMIEDPTSKVCQVRALVLEKEGGRILQILQKEIERLNAQKIQEGQAESK